MNARIRVILKEVFRSIPIFGWAMQIIMFVFISKNRDKDVPHLKRLISYLYNISGSKLTILLFPEGTSLTENRLAESNAYATEQHLPQFEFVLHPKPAGFVTCVRSLRGKGLVLHDITIAYTGYTKGDRPTGRGRYVG